MQQPSIKRTLDWVPINRINSTRKRLGLDVTRERSTQGTEARPAQTRAPTRFHGGSTGNPSLVKVPSLVDEQKLCL